MQAALVDEYQELLSTGGERFVHPFVFLVHMGRKSPLMLRSGLMTTASCWPFIGTDEPVFWGESGVSDLVTFCLFLPDFWGQF